MYLNLSKILQKFLIIALVSLAFLIIFEDLYSYLYESRDQTKVNPVKHESIAQKLASSFQKSFLSTVPVRKEEFINANTPITTDDGQMTEASAIVLWWTPFIGELEYTKNCGDSVCFFTADRKYFKHEKLKTMLFYGSNLEMANMPLPRQQNHLWALLHEESPKNVPSLMYRSTLSLFNLTGTFSQNSDFPLTLQYLENFEKLVDKQYFVDVGKKTRLQMEEDLAPVLYIQSICDAMSDRDAYVGELMKYIAVDSYGKCLNNKKNLPKSLTGEDYLSTIRTDEFYNFVARYKFVIAYENSVCDDYITEKLWRPLTLGVVPVYFGAPNIQAWLPNKDSAILIDRFDSPKHLAEHLLFLNNNDDKYNLLLSHKIHQNVTNEKLRKGLEHRGYETESIVEDFECFVCQESVGKSAKTAEELKIAEPPKDMCTENLIYPKMQAKGKTRNTWQSIFRQGKCESMLFSELIQQNKTFTKEQFQKELLRRFNDHSCEL